MRALLLIFLSNIVAYAQMNKPSNIDIAAHILIAKDMSNFVEENFKCFQTTKWQLLQMGHPLISEKFNRILTDKSKKYTLSNLPINDIFAYKKSEDEIAIYIFINISADETTVLNEMYGNPWNVTNADYLIGDYDMLLWQKNNMHISMCQNFATPTSPNSRILTISNIPLRDLLNTDSWE